MIIFYNKETGEITGTAEGWVHDASALKMKVVPQGLTEEQIGAHVINLGDLDEELARRLEHPDHPESIHNLRIDLEGEHLTEIL